MNTANLPVIIQGGMGVGISSWQLARAVSSTGQLGVVSGTALDQQLARRLQSGDPGGHLRRALDRFPIPRIAEHIWERFYVPGGKSASEPFITLPLPTEVPSLVWQQLCVVANFVEVTLAREGHDHQVGINYLEKIQLPHLPSIYGAMLAGVDYVLMGAGIPLKIPGILDTLAAHDTATYPLTVSGASPGRTVTLSFDPRAVIGAPGRPLKRPMFLAIVASDVLALTLRRRATGRVDGFVIEAPTAGGHNAPPRGQMRLDDRGEPQYGPRDVVDLDKVRSLGLPFWVAGGAASPERLQDAVSRGAAGVQIGTAFALCDESGLRPEDRHRLLDQVRSGTATVRTSALASPTGFPFKVAQLPGTLADGSILAARPRICDLGYLREAYETADGGVGFRCPAEPVNVYVDKGGDASDTAQRVCICNGLIAAAGLPQTRARKFVEPGIVTMGDDVRGVARFMRADGSGYSAADVIATMLGRGAGAREADC